MAGGVVPFPTPGMPGPLQPKPEDLNHPCQEQLPELKYCINDNPPWRWGHVMHPTSVFFHEVGMSEGVEIEARFTLKVPRLMALEIGGQQLLQNQLTTPSSSKLLPVLLVAR